MNNPLKLLVVMVVGLASANFLLVACSHVKKIPPAKPIAALIPVATKPTPLAVAPTPVPTKQPVHARYQHTVVKGDCLWDIASKPQYYNDPFLWPVIYKANRDEITDPDVIEVGQALMFPIKQDLNVTTVKMAHQEAYNRPTYVSPQK